MEQHDLAQRLTGHPRPDMMRSWGQVELAIDLPEPLWFSARRRHDAPVHEDLDLLSRRCHTPKERALVEQRPLARLLHANTRGHRQLDMNRVRTRCRVVRAIASEQHDIVAPFAEDIGEFEANAVR